MKARKTQARRDFALRLRSARIMAGHTTQESAARALEMPEAETYRRWERAETEPSIPDIVRICQTFAVSADMLLIGKPAAAQAPKAVLKRA